MSEVKLQRIQTSNFEGRSMYKQLFSIEHALNIEESSPILSFDSLGKASLLL